MQTPLEPISQTAAGSPPYSPNPVDTAKLQKLLDGDDYIAYSEAIKNIDASPLNEAQRSYFLGMLSFHLGKLNDAAPLLIKSLNSNGVNSTEATLTWEQVGSALETLGQINLKLTQYGASAQMYDHIDKARGSKTGDAEKGIREKRHLAVLLQNVPKQTAEIAGDFTLPRDGLEYPVSIPQLPEKQFSAQLDTGAEISVLSASTAKAWGVTMLEGSATLHGYGGGGFEARPGLIPALIIGKAELHNIAVYVTDDANLYIAQIKRQTNALLGYPVVAALGRLTFVRDGTLTVSAESPSRDLKASAAMWLSGHSLLVELGTMPIVSSGKLTGVEGKRLFLLDTGSGSTYLTDHYLAEHTNIFNGSPPEMAILAGADGVHRIPAFAAHHAPLFAGDVVILLNGPHILTQPTGGETEKFFGIVGQDTLGIFKSYTIDFRNMTLTVTP